MADETHIVGLKVATDTGDSVTNLNKMENAAGSLLSGLSNLEGGLGLVSKAAGALAAGLAAMELTKYIEDATLLAARVETLGVVMHVVGVNAGYTSREMDAFAAGVVKMGITTEVARQSTVRMAQAHIDLTKSQELARIAQDAAVIGGLNSSKALETLVHGIQSAQTDVLRSIGINVNFEESYKSLAERLGKTKDGLSEYEKTQARVNAVMESGKDITGAYEAAMGTAGKQVTSLSRYFEEIKLAVGEPFTETFSLILQDVNTGLKEMLGTMHNGKSTAQTFSNYMADTYKAIRAEAAGLKTELLGLQWVLARLAQGGFKTGEVATRFLTIGQYGGSLGAAADSFEGMGDTAYSSMMSQSDWLKSYNAAASVPGPALDPKEAMMLKMAKESAELKKIAGKKKDTGGGDSAETYTETDSTNQLWNSYLSGLYGFNNQLDKMNPNLTDFQKSLLAVDDALAKQLEAFAGWENNPGVQAYIQSLTRAASGVKEQLTINEGLKNGGSQGRDLTMREQSQFDKAAMYNKWEVADFNYRQQEEQAQFEHNNMLLGMQHDLDQALLLEDAKKTHDYEEQLIDQFEFEQEQAELQLQWTLDHTAMSEEQEERVRAQYRAKRLAAEVNLMQNIDRNEKNLWTTRLSWASTGTNAMLNLTNSLVKLTDGKSKEMFILQKAAAAANAVVNTATGVTQALASVPYPYNLAAAGMVAAAGAAEIAVIAATDIGGMASTSTTSLTGTGGGTTASPVVTQPSSATQAQERGTVTIVVQGNIIGEDEWVQNNLIPAIDRAGTRNVTITRAE